MRPALLAVFPALAAELTGSAAASLNNAFRRRAPLSEAQHPGTRVVFYFVASDALLAQVARGVPVDVFASPDEETMARAANQKLLAAGSRRTFAEEGLACIEEPGVTARILAHRGQAAIGSGAACGSRTAGSDSGVTPPGGRRQILRTPCAGAAAAGRDVLRSTIGARPAARCQQLVAACRGV